MDFLDSHALWQWFSKPGPRGPSDSPENLLEMELLELYPKPTASEILEAKQAIHLSKRTCRSILKHTEV